MTDVMLIVDITYLIKIIITKTNRNVLQTAIYLGVQQMEGQSCDTYYVSEMYGVPHALTSRYGCSNFLF